MGTGPAAFHADDLLAHAGWLQRLALELTRDASSADDLVQDTWLAALRHPPRGGLPLRPWLARIASNLAHNRRRSDLRRGDREARSARADEAPSPGEVVENLEAQRALVEVVLALEEPLRTTVVLRWFRGLNASEIARIQGVPAGTVRWRLKQALDGMREDLDRRFGGDRRAWCLNLMALGPRHGSAVAVAGGGWIVSVTTKACAAAALALFLGVIAWRSIESAASPATETSDGPRSSAAIAQVPADRRKPGASEADSQREPISAPSTAAAEASAGPAFGLEECCIVGRVEDELGRGIAAARVSAAGLELGDAGALFGRAARSSSDFSTRCDDEGRFRLAVPDLLPLVLCADAPDRAPACSSVCFAGESATLVLGRGGSLIVDVRALAEREGKPGEGPAAGARVRAQARTESASKPYWQSEATVDGSGRCVFTLVPIGDVHLDAVLAGFAPAQLTIHVSSSEESPTTLLLTPGGSIVGTVVEKRSGAPIADVRVGCDGLGFTRTDREGRFEIHDLALGDGMWGIGAHEAGYTSAFQYVKIASARTPENLRFELEPCLRAHGLVRDRAGLPVAQAKIAYVGEFSTTPFVGEVVHGETATDPGGRFEIGDLRPRTGYRLVVSADGFGTLVEVRGPYTADREEVDLGVFGLDAAGSIAGQVRGLELPEQWTLVRLASAPDGASEKGLGEPSYLLTTRTDRRGRFAFDGLASGRYRVELLESAKGKRRDAPVDVRLLELQPGERARDLALDLLARVVSGRVLDEQGTPRSGFTVALHPIQRDVAAVSVRTDKEGAFRIAPGTEGPFRLEASDDFLEFESRVIEPVLAGQAGIEIRTTRRHTGFSIVGRVLKESGEPAEGAYVAFTDASTGKRLGRVGIPDESGRFEVRDLEDATYDLEIVDFDRRYEPSRISGVRANGDPVEFRLSPRK